jgi:hypothetical protein
MGYCWPQDERFVKDVTPAELKSDWARYEFSFNSGDLENANACIYSKMKRADGKTDNNWVFTPGVQLDGLFSDGVSVLCDDFSLRETDTGLELITDCGFESSLHWNFLGGKPLSCDAYKTFSDFQRDYIAVLPEKLKSNFWHDEYNIFFTRNNAEHGIWLAAAQVALMNGGGKCSFLWTLFDQQWPNDHNNNDSFCDGDHRWGLMPNLRREILTPYPAYYAWGLVSRYTGGEGTYCFAGNNLSDKKIAANLNRLPDGNYTLTVVNYGKEPIDFEALFDTPLCRDFNRHSYMAATIKPDENATLPTIDKVYKKVEDKICDSLPPMSLAVYTTLGD